MLTIQTIFFMDQSGPKKRGRKPKGGKIIVPDVSEEKVVKVAEEQNIIVHLKCSTKDLEELSHFEKFSTVYDPTYNEEKLDSYDFNDTKYDNFVAVEPNKAKLQQHTHQFSATTNFVYNPFVSTDPSDDGVFNNKLVWTKVKELNNNYVNNEIYNKNSSCFWCTCPFSYQPVYIPKSFVQNDSIEVYGHFCTPECATAFLFKENIDTSCKWERYHILNKMYAKAFNYKKNIKPAPDPRYLLNKFFGTLSIDEYRALLRDDKLLLVVDKPLTRVLPELYEDNNEHEDLNKNFKLNNSSNDVIVKKTINKLKPVKAKIVAEQFCVA